VIVVLLIGVVLLGAAIVLARRAVAMPRAEVADQVSQIRSYGFGAVQALPQAPISVGSAINTTASRLGQLAARHLGGFREAELRSELNEAGWYRVAPMTFLGYRVIATLATPAVFFWLASLAGTSAAWTVIGTVVAIVGGWMLPMIYLHRKIANRKRQIELRLPELIDLLVLTVEAGLSFSAALQTAASRMQGPLGDELRLTLQEQNMGLGTTAALANLLTRCDTPSMRSFIRSITQGEKLGVSIGQILRNVATEMRKRRRQITEERAQKAPIKMLFPLVFLMLPPLFIVLLYPALHAFGQAFK
jgi:tight adherence protein C